MFSNMLLLIEIFNDTFVLLFIHAILIQGINCTEEQWNQSPKTVLAF